MNKKEKLESYIKIKYIADTIFNQKDIVKKYIDEPTLNEIIEDAKNGNSFIEEEKIFWKKKQGRIFEQFMVENLYKKFELIGWSCDKLVDKEISLDTTKYGSTIHNPDLLLRYKKSPWFILAIECKWTSEIENLKQLHKEQIQNYYKFERKEKVKVYMALGVGGTGDNPEDIYIFPLSGKIIKDKKIDIDLLDLYKIDKSKIDKELIKEFKKALK